MGLGSESLLSQVEEGEDEDNIMSLLRAEEAMKSINFNPTVTDENTWYTWRRFQQEPERERTSCEALISHKLDEKMKIHQIKKTGKDPHYGAERSLYTAVAVVGHGRTTFLLVV